MDNKIHPTKILILNANEICVSKKRVFFKKFYIKKFLKTVVPVTPDIITELYDYYYFIIYSSKDTDFYEIDMLYAKVDKGVIPKVIDFDYFDEDDATIFSLIKDSPETKGEKELAQHYTRWQSRLNEED